MGVQSRHWSQADDIDHGGVGAVDGGQALQHFGMRVQFDDGLDILGGAGLGQTLAYLQLNCLKEKQEKPRSLTQRG